MTATFAATSIRQAKLWLLISQFVHLQGLDSTWHSVLAIDVDVGVRPSGFSKLGFRGAILPFPVLPENEIALGLLPRDDKELHKELANTYAVEDVFTTAIREALERGEKLDFAQLGERGTSLRIKLTSKD